MRKVSAVDAKGERRLPEFEHSIWIGFFEDAVDRGLLPSHQLACDELVRQEHQFLDKLVGDVVLDFFEAPRFSLGIQPDLYFRKVQIERTCGKPPGSQFGCELPGDVKFSADLIDRRTLEPSKRLFIRQTCGASYERLGEAYRMEFSLAIDSRENRESEVIFVRSETA